MAHDLETGEIEVGNKVMMRTNLDTRACPLSRAMGEIGDAWMLLILWASLNGISRFDAYQEKLGVARNILSNRLKRLVALGLLERRPVRDGSRRCEYLPTDKAEMLHEPLAQLRAWGVTWCPNPADLIEESGYQGAPMVHNA